MTNRKVIGYTAGAFDVFHIGHLNLIKRSKNNCDHLIVGVTTDELVEKTKKKKCVIPFSERFEIVSSIRYVDEVVIQDDLDKILAWKKYQYDKLFSGDDWKNNPRWIGYEKELYKFGVEVIYFPYTKETSSTKIQQAIDNMHGEMDEF
jgi:glycerol-3-phosphate cytidylyltransferase